jgi:hypothetical protein
VRGARRWPGSPATSLTAARPLTLRLLAHIKHGLFTGVALVLFHRVGGPGRRREENIQMLKLWVAEALAIAAQRRRCRHAGRCFFYHGLRATAP